MTESSRTRQLTTSSDSERCFADAESDGIIQVSWGGAEYWLSGSTVKDRIAGSLAMAAYAREVAKNYDVTIALHTDHCAKQNLDSDRGAAHAHGAEEAILAASLVPVPHVDGSAIR